MPKQRQWNHIQDGGHDYALLDIFQEEGKMDLDDALRYLRDLVDIGRLGEDQPTSKQIKR